MITTWEWAVVRFCENYCKCISGEIFSFQMAAPFSQMRNSEIQAAVLPRGKWKSFLLYITVIRRRQLQGDVWNYSEYSMPWIQIIQIWFQGEEVGVHEGNGTCKPSYMNPILLSPSIMYTKWHFLQCTGGKASGMMVKAFSPVHSQCRKFH